MTDSGISHLSTKKKGGKRYTGGGIELNEERKRGEDV